MTIRAAFRSVHHHTTCTLHVEHPADEPPAALFEALAAEGWTRSPLPASRLPEGREEVTFEKRGSGFLGGWSVEETDEILTSARAVLAAHAVADVPLHNELLLGAA
jgi:hypothetical protein